MVPVGVPSNCGESANLYGQNPTIGGGENGACRRVEGTTAVRPVCASAVVVGMQGSVRGDRGRVRP